MTAYDSTNVIKKINDFENLLDVAIQIEDFLDSLDLYAFKNWFLGQIVKGPSVKRHWVSITLKYPYREMPDPAGALRLEKYGAVVSFEEAVEEVPAQTEEKIAPLPTDENKTEEVKIWLITVKIPRRFITELDVEGLEGYDEEDLEDAETAKEEGITGDEGITGEPGGEAAPEAGAEAAGGAEEAAPEEELQI